MSKVNLFTDNELKWAKNYFFRMATSEANKFAKASQYENISTEANGSLNYYGTILPTEEMTKMTTVMKNLSSMHSFYQSFTDILHWHGA